MMSLLKAKRGLIGALLSPVLTVFKATKNAWNNKDRIRNSILASGTVICGIFGTIMYFTDELKFEDFVGSFYSGTALSDNMSDVAGGITACWISLNTGQFLTRILIGSMYPGGDPKYKVSSKDFALILKAVNLDKKLHIPPGTDIQKVIANTGKFLEGLTKANKDEKLSAYAKKLLSDFKQGNPNSIFSIIDNVVDDTAVARLNKELGKFFPVLPSLNGINGLIMQGNGNIKNPDEYPRAPMSTPVSLDDQLYVAPEGYAIVREPPIPEEYNNFSIVD